MMIWMLGVGTVIVAWSMLSLLGSERHRRRLRLQADRHKTAPSPKEDVVVVG